VRGQAIFRKRDDAKKSRRLMPAGLERPFVTEAYSSSIPALMASAIAWGSSVLRTRALNSSPHEQDGGLGEKPDVRGAGLPIGTRREMQTSTGLLSKEGQSRAWSFFKDDDRRLVNGGRLGVRNSETIGSYRSHPCLRARGEGLVHGIGVLVTPSSCALSAMKRSAS